jgi:hypothetical protein
MQAMQNKTMVQIVQLLKFKDLPVQSITLHYVTVTDPASGKLIFLRNMVEAWAFVDSMAAQLQ